MYLRYGNYIHVLNEAAVAVEKEPLRNEGGLIYGMEETWTITGFLQENTPQFVALACALLEKAYSVNQQNVALILNDGVTVVRGLTGRSALGGVEVMGGVSYPDDGRASAEFSTYRNYQIRIRSRYPIATPLGLTVLLSWQEGLSFSGGGPRFVHLQPLNGPPVKQLVAQATPFRAEQQGSAVAIYGYPAPAPPIWPAAEQRDRRNVRLKAPRRSGGLLPVYTDYTVEWNYSFEDAGPLAGLPTLWR